MADKLMVVAHPDDESIFGGAQLLQEQGWKVLCMTNRFNRIRSAEYADAMRFAGAEWEMWDDPDEIDGAFDAETVGRRLERELAQGGVRMVVTHNPLGEYGHSQHRSLSRIVRLAVTLQPLFVFDCGPRLPQPVLARKLDLLDSYRSQRHVMTRLWPYIASERIVPYGEFRP